jgi:hypothetical protein
MSLRLRRGTNDERATRVFDLAEPVWVTDKQQLWIGNGTGSVDPIASYAGTGLSYSYNSTNGGRLSVNLGALNTDSLPQGGTNKYFASQLAQDAFAELLSNGTQEGILFTYNPVTHALDVSLDVEAFLVSTDTSPTLGGDLDLNSFDITGSGNLTFTGNIDIVGSLINSNLGYVPFNSVVIEDTITDEGYLTIKNHENLIKASLQLETFACTGSGGFATLSSSRGTFNAREKLEDGDVVYSLSFLSLGASGGVGVAANISAIIDGTTTNTIAPGSLDFSVANNSGTLISSLDIKSSGLTSVKKGFSTDAAQDLGNAGTVSLATVGTYFTTSAAETATLAAGTEGQIKTFGAINVTAGNMVITVSNAAWGGAGTMTFSTSGSGCTLHYMNSKWICVGNNGVTFA